MTGEPEVFKFDKLIVLSKKLGSSEMYGVKVIGMGEEFETYLPSTNAATAAYDVIEELVLAAFHPHQFFNRRRLAALQSEKSPHEVDEMIDHARNAVIYAERMKEHLKQAVLAVAELRARKLGG